VISVADYRFSRNDIGIVKDGRVDLRARVSNDNGATWDDITTVIAEKGKDSPEKSGFIRVGYVTVTKSTVAKMPENAPDPLKKEVIRSKISLKRHR
jgi:hypothetical protein